MWDKNMCTQKDKTMEDIAKDVSVRKARGQPSWAVSKYKSENESNR